MRLSTVLSQFHPLTIVDLEDACGRTSRRHQAVVGRRRSILVSNQIHRSRGFPIAEVYGNEYCI
jgi:hypothetical protein